MYALASGSRLFGATGKLAGCEDDASSERGDPTLLAAIFAQDPVVEHVFPWQVAGVEVLTIHCA